MVKMIYCDACGVKWPKECSTKSSWQSNGIGDGEFCGICTGLADERGNCDCGENHKPATEDPQCTKET